MYSKIYMFTTIYVSKYEWCFWWRHKAAGLYLWTEGWWGRLFNNWSLFQFSHFKFSCAWRMQLQGLESTTERSTRDPATRFHVWRLLAHGVGAEKVFIPYQYIYIYPSIYTLLVWQEDFIIYSYELWYYILRKYEWILGCTLLLLRRK